MWYTQSTHPNQHTADIVLNSNLASVTVSMQHLVGQYTWMMVTPSLYNRENNVLTFWSWERTVFFFLKNALTMERNLKIPCYVHTIMLDKKQIIISSTIMIKQGRESLSIYSVYGFDLNSTLLDRQINYFSVYMFFFLD